MASDWIPHPDAEFHTFFTAFKDWCATNGVAKGLTAPEVTALSAAFDDWSDRYAAHLAAQNAARTAKLAKDDARTAAEEIVRTLARKFQSSSAMSDTDRMAAQLTVASPTRSAAPAPTTRPIATVDTTERLRHTIHFKDVTTPNSRKKPDGVMGVEIWCALGATPPPDASTCSFVALDTNSPYVVEYDGGDANKTAHYLLRWVNTRGEKGPWSETVSATIGA